MTNARNLSRLEKSVIPASIAAGLDLDAIEIHKRKWTFLTPANVTVARGTKIFYPNDPGSPRQLTDNLRHLAHMVHEVVHVWQYEKLGINFYAPQWLDRRYHYRLKAGDMFQSFGLEQQAAIAEDSFLVRHRLQPRWAKNNPSLQLLQKTVANCDINPIEALGQV